MTHSIYKYPIPTEDRFSLALPAGARILSVGVQRGKPVLWAMVNPHARIVVDRVFRLAGTGHPIDEPLDSLAFVGTVLLYADELVLHLFEVRGDDHA